MKKVTLIVVGAGLLAAGCGGGQDRVTTTSVAKKCDPNSKYVNMSSDEKTIDFLYRTGSEPAKAVYHCLLKETRAPASIENEVDETREIDGTQSADWNGWQMLWNYDGPSKSIAIQLGEA